MLRDVTAAEFCSSEHGGELFEMTFGAANHKFYMCRFNHAWIDQNQLFPISNELTTCKELFKIYYLDDKYLHYYSEEFAKEITEKSNFDHEGVFVLGGTSNYWHFLVDHFSKIPLLQSFSESSCPPILVNSSLNEGYIEFLTRACKYLNVGVPRVITEKNACVRIRNSFVPCLATKSLRFSFLRDVGVALQDGRSTYPRRLFLRRVNVSNRIILNESELEQRLSNELGFVAVDTGSLSVMDQINLVQNCEIIVGGNGAALTNIIFASRLKQLIVLYAAYRQPFIQQACRHFQISEHSFRGRADPGSGDGRRADNQNYVVDADYLLWLVDSVIKSGGR